MKTTLDIPDALFRQVKARAALEGRPMKAFVVDALGARLQAANAPDGEACQPAWKRVFGSLKHQRHALQGIQATIDQEFESINPDDWK